LSKSNGTNNSATSKEIRLNFVFDKVACEASHKIPRFLLHVLPATNHFLQIKDHQMSKKTKRRAWTKADIRTLKGLAKKKTHASSIARVLKRTEGSTRQKAFSMGVSMDSRG
jgi:hypothetical protein